MDAINLFQSAINLKVKIEVTGASIAEHEFLTLDTYFATTELGIKHLYDSGQAITRTANWYSQYLKGEDPQRLMLRDIETYWGAHNDL